MQIRLSVKNQNRMANIVDPDETAHYKFSSGSTMFAQASGLVYRAERVKLRCPRKMKVDISCKLCPLVGWGRCGDMFGMSNFTF